MTRSYTSLLSWFGLTLAASLMLYHTSDRVTALDRQLRDINLQIETEQQSLHVLKAEWVYLTNPARIEAAAKRNLALQPTAPGRVVAIRNMSALLPLHNGIEPAPTQLADNDLIHDAPAPSAAKPVAAATQHKAAHVFAAIDNLHINDHVILQHGAATQASTDTIGAMIGSLSLRP